MIRVYGEFHSSVTFFPFIPPSPFSLPFSLAKLVDRTVDASITITDGAVYVATEQGECELGVSELGADS
ncbi:MAG: hypothetical protein ACE37N_17675 [Pseudohongiellaceae bacterium]